MSDYQFQVRYAVGSGELYNVWGRDGDAPASETRWQWLCLTDGMTLDAAYDHMDLRREQLIDLFESVVAERDGVAPRERTPLALVLRLHPQWGEVVLDDEELGMFYTIHGSPYARPAAASGWPVVRTAAVRSLFDWQSSENYRGFATHPGGH